MKKTSNVISFGKARTQKQLTSRDHAFARASEHYDLLMLNEFNFESPDDHTLVIHEAGKAWLHKIASVFGLPRFPENEAELLGTQQMLLFLVVASKPTPVPKQDADWLAAGKGVLEDTAPWALETFNAYLNDDVEGMRHAMTDDKFIECAAQDWRETQTARDIEAGITKG